MPVNNTKRIDFPIVGSFGEDQVGKINSERTINMYEVFDPNGKKQNYLAPSPGLTQEDTFSQGVNGRAAITFLDATYFVVRSDVYRLDSALTLTRISTGAALFTTTSGHVGIAANEFQVAFVDGVRLLIWDNNAATFTDETANLPNPPGNVLPKDITYMDGYFILINGNPANRNQFWVSELNNGKVWNAGQDALTNSESTILSVCEKLKRRVFLFGETNAEMWLNAGQADFPLRRDNNLLLGHGITARQSLVKGNALILGMRRESDVMLYLSNSLQGVGGVMMVTGTTPERVSTREVNEVIQNLPNPNDASGVLYKINGQSFYQLNFTEGNRTLIYNISTDKWSELEALDGSRQVINAHAYFKDKHWVIGYNDDILYEMDESFVDITRDSGAERIKITRITRVMSVPTYDRIRIDRLQIDMLQGVGLPNLQNTPLVPNPDVDPVIFLSISEDGGVTYHDFGPKPIGRSGKRITRTFWPRLGVRRDAIVKVVMFNNVPRYILGGAVDIEVLPE